MRKDRQQNLFGGAGVGGGFENHQLAGVKVMGDFLTGADDEAHVRVLGFPERRGDADVDGVELEDGRKIGSGAQLAGGDQRGQGLAGNIADVGLAGVHAIDFFRADIDTGYRKAGLGELDGKRQSDVAEADDSDAGAPLGDLMAQNLSNWMIG